MKVKESSYIPLDPLECLLVNVVVSLNFPYLNCLSTFFCAPKMLAFMSGSTVILVL